MSTTLIYNGVEIRNCLTKKFDQECVYDESGTDKIYDKFTVRVVGYVHRILQSTTPTVGVVPAINVQTGLSMGLPQVAQNQQLARRLLMEPRREFTLNVGGYPLLHCEPRLTPNSGDETTGDVTFGDVNNGPKPKSCNVTSIVGTELLPIEFEIEVCKVECDSPNNYSGVLNNRWSMKDQIDGDWYTTRTITGRLRVADVNLNPQAFRPILVPPLQFGFKRESIETTTSLDGLTLDYTVIDKELFAACPSPGTTWEGTHTLSTGDGSQTHGEINLSMAGPKDADKRIMIQAMALICQQKLNMLDLGNFITQAVIVDHMHLNKVEMRVLVDQTGAVANPIAMINLPDSNFAKVIELPEYNKDLSRVPAVFGTATVTGLFVSYLQSPCSYKHGVPQTTAKPPEPDGNDERSEAENVYTYEGQLPIDSEIANNYSQEAAQGVYTFYEIETEYTDDDNTVALPIARPLDSESSNPYAPTVDFVSLAPTSTTRKVIVRAQRYGKPPLMPAARSITLGSQRIERLKGSVKAMVPQLTADGKTRRYEIECVYEYALSRPVKTGESFGIGKIPWDTATLADNAIGGEVFSTELLE